MTSKPTTKKLDEILDSYAAWTIKNVEHGIYIPLQSPEAKVALLTLYKETMLELIGEDEDNTVKDIGPSIGVAGCATCGLQEDCICGIRNELRVELRKKLEEL